MRTIGPNRAYKHIRMVYDLSELKDALYKYKNRLQGTSDLLDDIGREGKKIIQDKLSPLNRTGDLINSWRIERKRDSVTIKSDDWAASSIEQGFNQPPPKDDMLAWMDTKPDFAGMRRKEKERVAFAIRRSMLAGNKPGPQSTLGSLAPIGKRQYSYLKETREDLRKYIERMLMKYKI